MCIRQILIIALVSTFFAASSLRARLVFIDGVDCEGKQAFIELLKSDWKPHEIIADDIVVDRGRLEEVLRGLKEDGRDAIVITNFETADDFRTFLDVAIGYDSLFVLAYTPLSDMLSSQDFDDDLGLTERCVLDKVANFLTLYTSTEYSTPIIFRFPSSRYYYLKNSLENLESETYCTHEDVTRIHAVFSKELFCRGNGRACLMYARRHYDIVLNLSAFDTTFDAVASLKDLSPEVPYPEAPVLNIQNQSWRQGYCWQRR